MGVGIVTALEEATRQHLEKIGAQDDDEVLLGFTHAFRSVNIRVGDFLRRDSYTDELLDTLMRPSPERL